MVFYEGLMFDYVYLRIDTFLNTLTRTLTENHKKSMELSINLLSGFYVLSNYEQFHDLLMTVSVLGI